MSEPLNIQAKSSTSPAEFLHEVFINAIAGFFCRNMRPKYISVEHPGVIEIRLSQNAMLIYGAANDTWNADLHVLRGGEWQYDDSPDCLNTHVKIECENPEIVGFAIAMATIAFMKEHNINEF